MSLDDLGTVREALDRHGLAARKSFGQHFLLDLNITRKVARAAGDLAGRAVLEVGPGPGGLTRALLETDAAHVIAVEKDARFLPLLQELAAASAGRLTVVEADALEVDEAALLAAHAPEGAPLKVVANLPYNVGTPLLVKWLTGPRPIEAMALMFQKEVAERIVAAPGGGDYGRLAVLSQSLAEAEIAFTLPARAFTPPPKVDSAVAVLRPHPHRPPADELAALEAVTRAAFGQRRKMLRSSLKPLGGDALCAAATIDPSARAEQLTIADFRRLAQAVASGSSSRP